MVSTETSQDMKNKLKLMRKILEENSLKAKTRRNKNLPLPNLKIHDYVIAKDFRIIPGLNKTLHTKYVNEIFVVEKVKTRSVVARSLSNYTLKLISFNNLKIVNANNFDKLNIPQDIMKLLLRDSYTLTQAEKFFIAEKSPTVLLPEPDPSLLEEDVSDYEVDFEDEENVRSKSVTFDLDPEPE